LIFITFLANFSLCSNSSRVNHGEINEDAFDSFNDDDVDDNINNDESFLSIDEHLALTNEKFSKGKVGSASSIGIGNKEAPVIMIEFCTA